MNPLFMQLTTRHKNRIWFDKKMPLEEIKLRGKKYD